MERYLKAISKRTSSARSRLQSACRALFAPHKGPLSRYNEGYPLPQQMIDLFKGEWMSLFPAPYQDLKAGIYPLFNDARLLWGMEQLGGVQNKTVLELGPLEGGHSYLLEKYGAAAVTAVEANPRAFLKCLLVKQLFHLQRVNFLFGDFNSYLRYSSDPFDLCVASGVLYHMSQPIELLKSIAQRSQQLFLWTQYYDEKICSQPGLKRKFLPPRPNEVDGFKHAVHPFKYGASRFWSTFIGGPATTSSWLSRRDIIGALHHFGYPDVKVGFEEVHPVHGPSFALVAYR